jgi:integrase
MRKKPKRYVGRVYLGHGQRHWVGRFATKKERDDAVARAKVELSRRQDVSELTCGEWAERFLARYQRDRKDSSYETASSALRLFINDFGEQPIVSVTRLEAMDWAERVAAYRLPVVVTLFNAAVDAELVERNPFRGLSRRSRGRSDEHPPTTEEMDRLIAGCSALGWYAPQMRALLVFAAYSGMRPGELFALEWPDIDFDAMRVRVGRRVYKGRVDLPKSNKVRTIALTPPAREAILGHPTRQDGQLVFRAKRGGRLSQPTLSSYWAQVLSRAGLSFDFYLATKHWCVHYMHATLGLPPRVIAEQMGWTLRGVLKLLAVYGHGDIGALEEIDRAFRANVTPLRAVNSATTGTQGGPQSAS